MSVEFIQKQMSQSPGNAASEDPQVVEAREDQAEVVCALVEREMVKAGEQTITLVPVVADAKIADYWSK